MGITSLKTGWLAATALLATILLVPSVIAEAPTHQPHDTLPPEITPYMTQPAILVFSKTRGWRHNEGIAGADRFLAEYASENGMGLFTTVNAAVFNPEQLARFEIVVFNNMSGEALSDEQELAFQAWLEAGGGLIGLHSAGDASHTNWPWFDDSLIGPEFIGHPADPQFQDARVVNLAPDHPILAGIPADWIQNDEWYSFDTAAKLGDATPLLGLDESTYSPQNLVYGDHEDLRMGDKPEEHPIAWARCAKSGRFVYSGLGHSHTVYDNETYRKFLNNAIGWARDPRVCDQADQD